MPPPPASMASSLPGTHRILGLNAFESSSSSSSSSWSWHDEEIENDDNNVNDDNNSIANDSGISSNATTLSGCAPPPSTADLECVMSPPATRTLNSQRASLLEQARVRKAGDSKLAIAVPIDETQDERVNVVVYGPRV
jgi:hypothetical protein